MVKNDQQNTGGDVTRILAELARVIESRKGADPDVSYVASLHAKGMDAILKKIGEEAAELVIAACQEDNKSVIHETADLWFHTLVLLSHKGLTPEDILTELDRRFGTSGISEKASRKT